MGVRGLWNILSPVEEYRPLSELGGETLAVDLSIWVCGDISVKYNTAVTTKLYLRNLFFRTLNLLRQNTLPVMVIDGVAPALKATTIGKRQNLSNHRDFRSNLLIDPSVLVQRRRFSKISGECCVLLNALGVPWVQSPGEAEAMCAMLNSSERVDACITNDGDAFLYGASTVYRHFTMDCRDASVRVYRSSRVREELHFSQRLLVVLGILLGCDYWPTGVAGVGKAGVHRLIGPLRSLPDAELMDLVSWLSTRDSSCDQTVFFTHPFFKDVDPKLRRLYAKIGTEFQNCPVKEILHEFLASPEARLWSLPSVAHVSTWKRPDPRAVVLFCRDQLDWKPDYSLHHLLPVLALWDMRHPQLLKSILVDDATQLIPIRIVKKRTVAFLPSYEVEWRRMDFDVWTRKSGLSTKALESVDTSNNVKINTDLTDKYTFSVPVVEFEPVYGELCELFRAESAKVCRGKSRKPSTNVSEGNKKPSLVDLLQNLRLDCVASPNRDRAVTSRVPVWDSSSDSFSPTRLTTSSLAIRPGAIQNVPERAKLVLTAFNRPAAEQPVRLSTALAGSRQLESSLLTCSPTVNSFVWSVSPVPVESDSCQANGSRLSLNDDIDDSFSAFSTPLRLTDRIAKRIPY
ncbi:Flap endonuclease GEN 1 [Paragonimus heterotremus]|uniref:Flap endonuclease GEN 1 n=1 Tax=Paragonimus heterotremus TaxID=100268 RepID=A0A8J4WZP4_9TREM|nr:Flap endonuclease GEN 1 [Paragonimus heterotremus]